MVWCEQKGIKNCTFIRTCGLLLQLWPEHCPETRPHALVQISHTAFQHCTSPGHTSQTENQCRICHSGCVLWGECHRGCRFFNNAFLHCEIKKVLLHHPGPQCQSKEKETLLKQERMMSEDEGWDERPYLGLRETMSSGFIALDLKDRKNMKAEKSEREGGRST